MKANSCIEQEEYQDSEAHFKPTGWSELHCEKWFENTFPTEHDFSQKKQRPSTKHPLKKGQDLNGGPEGKPSHANIIHTANFDLQNYF